MHLKNRLLAILAVLGVVALMFYFSTLEIEKAPEAIDEEIETSMEEDKIATLHFWYSDESMSDYINSAAVAFGEKYDARVFPHLVSDSAYLEAINQATLHEQMPDAYLISNDSLEKAYLAGLAVEVEDTKGILNTDTFPQTALDAVNYKGRQVAYPLFFETTALLYNETYLQEWALQQAKREAENLGVEQDEATLLTRRDEIMINAVPTTMDAILSMADSFDPPETVEGIFKWDVSDIFYNYYFVGNYMVVGGDCGDNKSNININNAEAVSSLEVYKALNQFFSIESETVSYESVLQDFIDGKIVFTIATSDAIATIEAAKEEGTFAYNYGVSLMPHPSEELIGRSLSVTGTVAINGYSENRELANAFAAFLTDEYIQELYTRSGRVAANHKANADNGALQIFKEEYAYSVSLPKMMETSNFWVQLEILFSKVWNGGDVAALVAELAAQIDTQVTVTE